jgi:DNA (cytosine-5)-methyltransferase 1
VKIVSLFSGAGGLDLGFKMAGHTIILANDLYTDAVETYKTNESGYMKIVSPLLIQ